MRVRTMLGVAVSGGLVRGVGLVGVWLVLSCGVAVAVAGGTSSTTSSSTTTTSEVPVSSTTTVPDSSVPATSVPATSVPASSVPSTSVPAVSGGGSSGGGVGLGWVPSSGLLAGDAGSSVAGRGGSLLPAARADVYAAAVLGDSPAGYWKLHGPGDLGDYVGGSAPDVVADSFDGPPSIGVGSGVWSGVDAVRVSRGEFFDAGSGWLTSTEWSFEGWLRASGGEYPNVASVGEQFSDVSGSGYQRQTLSMGWSGHPEGHLWLNDGSSPTVSVGVSGSGDYDPSVWHHFVASYDGDVLVLYQDGVPVGEESGSVPWLSMMGEGFRIAANLGSCDCTVEDVDFSDVAVYSYALDASSVAAHWKAAGGVLPLTYAELLGGSNPAQFCNSCFVSRALGQVGYPVDAQTGNFYHSFVDVGVPGRGIGRSLTRTYNSMAARSSDEPGSGLEPSVFGAGWSWNYGMNLVFDGPDRVVFTQENGSQVFFDADGAGGWQSGSNVFAVLTEAIDGSFQVVRAGTDTFDFDPSGRLVSMTDRYGDSTVLVWPSVLPGDLVVTAAGSGAQVRVGLDGNGQPVSASTSTGHHVTFGYVASLVSSDPILSEATVLGGGVWGYGYDDTDAMVVMDAPAGSGGSRRVVNRYDYDPVRPEVWGRVVAQWDPVASAAANGAPSDVSTATRFDYDTPGETLITTPSGVVSRQEFRSGYMVAETVGIVVGPSGLDESGALTTSFTYDADTSGGASITDPNGNTATFTYDSNGRVTTSRDALGNTTSYDDYNTFGEPGLVTDPAGFDTVTSFDGYGNVSSVAREWDTNPAVTPTVSYTRGDVTHRGDVTSVTDPEGHVTQMSYVAGTGALASVTDAAGNIETMGFNTAGQQVWRVAAGGNASGASPGSYRSTAVFDDASRVVIATDAIGTGVSDGFQRANGVLGAAETGETWNVLAGSWSITNHHATVSLSGSAPGVVAVGDTATPTQGSIVSLIAGDSGMGAAFWIQSVNDYWMFTRLADSSDWGVFHVTDGVAVLVGDPVSGCCVAGDRIRVGTGTYFAAFALVFINGIRVAQVTNPGLTAVTRTGIATLTGGEGVSGFASGTGGRGFTDVVYDTGGQRSRVIGPHVTSSGDLPVTSFTHDAVGRETSVTAPDGSTTHQVFNADGQLTEQMNANNVATSYSYDPVGRVASVTAANGHTTTYTYSLTPGHTPSEGGQVVKATPDGVSVTTTMDANGLPVHIEYSDATPDVEVTRDPLGRIVSETTALSVVSTSFDSLGNETVVERDGDTVAYGYNQAGQTTQITYPNAEVVTEAYDGSGRWVGFTDWDDNMVTYTYGPDGNLATRTSPGGVTDTWVYDANGNPASIQVTQATAGVLASWTYDRQLGGALRGVDATGIGTDSTWTFDPVDQLTSQTTTAGSTAYGYDPAGHPTTLGDTTQVFGDGGELCWAAPTVNVPTGADCATTPPAGATTYTWDVNGRPTNATAGWLSQTMHWNANNQLVATTLAGLPAYSGTYTYAPDGLRTSKTIGAVTTSYTWDDRPGAAQLIAENNNYYIYGPDGLPALRTGADPTITLHQDTQQSTRLTTNTAGTITSTRTYTPWGATTTQTGTPPTLGWNSQYQDPETHNYYLRNRYYNPDTAQFLTPDPLETLTHERYEFAGNDPINGSDPSGLCWGPICSPSEYKEKAKGAVNSGVSAMTGGRANCVRYATCSGSTSNAYYSAGDVVDGVYEAQGWAGRNVIRPGLGFLVEGFGFTVGSSVGLLVGDAVCGVGPWAIPCAVSGGVIGSGAGLWGAYHAWKPADDLLHRIPGWC